MSDFEKLLGQLSTMADEHQNLAKSLPHGGEENAAAVTDGQETGSSEESGTVAKSQGDDTGGNAGAAGSEGKPLAKSVTVDDEEYEVVEVDELVKSLAAMDTRMDERDQILVKSVEGLMGIANQQKEMLQSQGQLIKSLQDQLASFGRTGAGRKTMLAVSEKPNPMTKSMGEEAADEGMTGQEFMAKSQAAFDQKVISGLEYNTIDVCLRQGQQVNPELVSKVLAASNK